MQCTLTDTWFEVRSDVYYKQKSGAAVPTKLDRWQAEPLCYALDRSAERHRSILEFEYRTVTDWREV